MTIFQLKRGVYFTKGASGGAIMDTNTGLVYSINKQACDVLDCITKDNLFWQTLFSMELVNTKEKPHELNFTVHKRISKLDFVWFEVVSLNCNQRCVHCYAGARPPVTSQRIFTTNPSTVTNLEILNSDNYFSPRINFQRWIEAIEETYNLGCVSCQFIGGEPLFYTGEKNESVFDLIAEAKRIGFISIELFTNATLLTENKIKKIKNFGVKVATSLYSNNPSIHDSITGIPGSHKKLTESLKQLKAYGIPTRVEIVLMAQNQDNIQATIDYLQGLGHQGRNPDPLRPIGRGKNEYYQPSSEFLIKYGLRLEPNFIANKKLISKNVIGNPCLLGKIAITEFGDVLPCIFARNHSVGNLFQDKSLAFVVNNQRNQIVWSTTKDYVLVCKDCEYRYLCPDCRPLSDAMASGKANFLNAPYPRCTYNPYNREWGGGIWKVEENGRPYYDRYLAREIYEYKNKYYSS